MAMFPTLASRMYTPCHILKCETMNNKGQVIKTFSERAETVFIAFSNFQGTEKNIDGVLSIENTASVCSPFIPDLENGDAIKLLDSGKVYEIINSPENWNMQNLYLLFKVRAVESGV